MSYKDMCQDYVDARSSEEDDGWWAVDPYSFKHIEGPFHTESELNGHLWKEALQHAHETYIQ